MTRAGGNFNAYIGKPVPQSVISALNVPNSLSNRIGAGTVSFLPFNNSINSPPLVNGSKPEVLYIGAEYCPYCAATRWGMIIALSRFGSFSNLHYMASNVSDGDTPTFTFYNSTYTSSYISFISVETTTRSRFQPLQNPTSFQNTIFSTFNPSGGIPFVDFGNVSILAGSPILPELFQGYNWTSIIASLNNTNSSISQSIVGSANAFTAEICRITKYTPSSVCSQPYVASILRAMGVTGA